MSGPAFAFVGVALIAAVGGLACVDEPEGVTIPENAEIMRQDSAFQEIEHDLRAGFEQCVDESGKISCLSIFLEDQEAQLSACLDLLFGWEKELCTLTLELIAAERGWQTRSVDRSAGLLTDSETHRYHADCIAAADDFQCSSRFMLLEEYKFDICADLWGRGQCVEVIGELLAAAEATAR